MLEGLGDEAFVTERTGDGLVLGFSSPTGASSMADIPLGNVRSCPVPVLCEVQLRVKNE